MKHAHALAAMALLAAVAALPAHAQGTAGDSVQYALGSPPSDFEWGCFGPCECPVLIRSPLDGTFLLVRSGQDPLFTHYDVLDVHWKVPDASQAVTITGSGTYRRGGEVANQEQLTLVLSFDGGPPRTFDSGLVPARAPFPEIDARISLHGEYCLDSVLAVDAKPASVTGVGGGLRRPALTAIPNPFSSTADVQFTLLGDGLVDVGIFDVTGRRVAALVRREWLPHGAYARRWDGRMESGLAAPPGLYLVRLDSPAGRVTRPLARVR